MSNNKGQVFFFGLIAIIVGWAAYKQFNFDTLQFKKPALAVVYILTFVMSVFFLLRNARQK